MTANIGANNELRNNSAPMGLTTEQYLGIPAYMTSNVCGHTGGIINLNTSQYERLEQEATHFNDLHGTARAGKFNRNIKHSARQLIFEAVRQLEDTRRGRPQAYLLAMSGHCDTIKIHGNRAYFAAMFECSPRTAYAHIKFLEKADVGGYTIVRKVGQSSSHRMVYRNKETGEVNITFQKATQKRPELPTNGSGQGDWMIHLDKRALVYNYPEIGQKLATTAFIENQPVMADVRQKLPSLIPQILKDTSVSNNITPTGVLKGAALPQPVILAPGTGDEKREKPGGGTFAGGGGGGFRLRRSGVGHVPGCAGCASRLGRNCP